MTTTTPSAPDPSNRYAVMRDWNGVRFDGSQAGHVESYFMKLNDPEERHALWLKATILKKHGTNPVAEAWAIAFERNKPPVGVKREIPFEAASFAADRFEVTVADLHMQRGQTAGSIEHLGRRIEWDLKFTTEAAALVPFPHLKMYEGKLPSSKLVTPHPDSRFSGSFAVDGERTTVESWRGMQGHNWGRGHAELYAWAHCNQWHETDDLVVEGLTGRVRVGPLLAPPLTLMCVRHRGVRFDLNAAKALLKNRGEITPRSWRFRAQGPRASVEGEFFAATDDFGGLYYENPDGAMTHCLNSKIAEGRLRLELAGRAPLIVTTRSAALEIGTRDPSHGVRMLI
ncbi:MAG: tocopherol cyclase family protein [Polyangiaceae bacterium]